MSAHWYIVNTTSGYENKVAKAIRDEASKRGMSDIFEEIVVPVETHTEIRRGKRVGAQKKILPGYIMIKMTMNEGSWGLVKRIPNVAKFLGADNRPARVSDKEVQSILRKVEEEVAIQGREFHYDLAEVIKIIDGPFETFTGVIEGVDRERARLKVIVSILGRDASVELEFRQVEKVDKQGG